MMPGFGLRALRSLAAVTSAAMLVAAAGAGFASAPDGPADPRAMREGSRLERKKKARPKLVQPHIVPSVPPHFLSLSDPLPAAPGQKITIVVRLFGGAGTPRRAAFHLITNPDLVRYVGSVPTGAGALIVQPSSHPGELVVYRSSTPDGFSQTESLVELEFEALAPGTTTVLLTDVRLFDGGARDLQATYESGTLVIE